MMVVNYETWKEERREEAINEVVSGMERAMDEMDERDEVYGMSFELTEGIADDLGYRIFCEFKRKKPKGELDDG